MPAMIKPSPAREVGTITHGDGYTVTECEPTTIGTTTYRVQVMRFDSGNEDVTITGPRGGVYYLRPFIERDGDTGLRQPISWNTGKPLTVRGNPVRVYWLGGMVEVAKRR